MHQLDCWTTSTNPVASPSSKQRSGFPAVTNAAVSPWSWSRPERKCHQAQSGGFLKGYPEIIQKSWNIYGNHVQYTYHIFQYTKIIPGIRPWLSDLKPRGDLEIPIWGARNEEKTTQWEHRVAYAPCMTWQFFEENASKCIKMPCKMPTEIPKHDPRANIPNIPCQRIFQERQCDCMSSVICFPIWSICMFVIVALSISLAI
jgi:hypothetical protein